MAQNSPPQETQPLPPPSYESVVSGGNSISHVYLTPGAPLTPVAPPLDEATAHLDPGAPNYRARFVAARNPSEESYLAPSDHSHNSPNRYASGAYDNNDADETVDSSIDDMDVPTCSDVMGESGVYRAQGTTHPHWTNPYPLKPPTPTTATTVTVPPVQLRSRRRPCLLWGPLLCSCVVIVVIVIAASVGVVLYTRNKTYQTLPGVVITITEPPYYSTTHTPLVTESG